MHPQRLLATKLRLERRLTEALAAWAEAALADWADARLRGAAGFPAVQRTALRRLLEAHYAATVAVFDPVAVIAGAELGLAAVEDERFARWLAAKAASQAEFIIGTLDRDLVAAESEARLSVKSDAAVMPKVKPGWSVVMISSLKAAAKKFATRLPGIANVNTQDVAERTRSGRITVVPPGQEDGVIVKIWNSLLDGRERATHGAAHGQAQLVENPFEVGGEQLRFPGDTALGASLGNVINCFPGSTPVIGRPKAVTRHWYDGLVVEVTTAGGNKLTGTPNHPVLTPKGWVALGALDVGDHVVGSSGSNTCDGLVRRQATAVAGALDIHDVETSIAQAFNAFSCDRRSVRIDARNVHFHGDRPAEDVHIVPADGRLLCEGDASSGQHAAKIVFAAGLLAECQTLASGFSDDLAFGSRPVAPGGVGGGGQKLTGVGAQVSHSHRHGCAAVADGDPARDEPLSNCPSVTVEASCDFKLRESALVERDEIIDVKVQSFAGHVYNLETVDGFYIAGGIVVHNCRCWLDYYMQFPDGRREPLGISTPQVPAGPMRRPGAPIGSNRPKVPTTALTFATGRMRGRIILADGGPATITVEGGAIRIARGRDTVASAQLLRGADGRYVLGQPNVAADYRGTGIEQLLARSVEETNKLKPAAR